jgi:DNA-binding XRE family transcriptional regulator
MASVVLLTDRAAFETQWTAACLHAGLTVRAHEVSDFGRIVEQATAMVIDADGERIDTATLVALVGQARAHGVVTAVAISPSSADRTPRQDDLLLELCAGLIARSSVDFARITAGLARRTDADRDARFESLAQAIGSEDLLAILGDGSALLVDRPFSPDDRGEVPVDTVELAQDFRSARIGLRDGATFELRAVELAQGRLAGARTIGDVGTTEGGIDEGAAALGGVDGVRLGQRLRALRLAAGLTQAELARRTGIHRPNIARVEAGRHTPSLETLARLAAAIGVKTERVIAD